MEHSLVTLVRLCDCSFRLEPDFVVLILLVYLYTDIMIYIHTYIYIYIYYRRPFRTCTWACF